MDKGRYTAMIFLDLKKHLTPWTAKYYLKNWRSMLSSVQGIPGLHLIYLAMQFRRVNGVILRLDDISCAVPQGSCLGPIFYAKQLIHCVCRRYHNFSKNIADLNEYLNGDLYNLKQWLQGKSLH